MIVTLSRYRTWNICSLFLSLFLFLRRNKQSIIREMSSPTTDVVRRSLLFSLIWEKDCPKFELRWLMSLYNFLFNYFLYYFHILITFTIYTYQVKRKANVSRCLQVSVSAFTRSCYFTNEGADEKKHPCFPLRLLRERLQMVSVVDNQNWSFQENFLGI